MPLGYRPAGSSPHQTIADSSAPPQVGFSVSLRGDWAVFGVGFVRHLTSSRASETILKTCNSLVKLAVVDFSVASRLLFLFFPKIHFFSNSNKTCPPPSAANDLTPTPDAPHKLLWRWLCSVPSLPRQKHALHFFHRKFPVHFFIFQF